MRKLTLLLLASAVATGSYAQTKKVLLEDFTGIWCQHCPNGAKAIEDLEAQNPTNFLAVASHNYANYGPSADVLATTEGMAVATGLGVSGFPAGAIDRKIISGGKIPMGIDVNGTAWKNAVPGRLGAAAIVSVSFANTVLKTDGTYEGDVTVKFTSAPDAGTQIAVQVYVLEDGIEATVADNTDQSSSGKQYGGANPLLSTHGFYHHHTLRASLGGTWGWTDVVPATVELNKEYTKHFSFQIPASAVPKPWVKEKVHLYAFVAYNGAASADKKEILNAEKTTLNAFFPASVKQVNEVKIITAYPNPARTNDVINVEYTAPESGAVKMQVMNALGQVVAVPYNSYEVKGTHTIRWRASEHSLAAGTYIMQVTTAAGSNIQKITIH